MKLLGSEALRDIDRRSMEELGIPGTVLMENAGRAAVRILLQEFNALYPGPVLVLCGKGNNGGDGYVLARTLGDLGWAVQVALLGSRADLKGDAAAHCGIYERCGGSVREISDASELQTLFSDRPWRLLVDGLLGTGTRGGPREPFSSCISLMNDHPAPILSLDIPSGVDADSGAVPGEAIRADVTVTFGSSKVGLETTPGVLFTGRRFVAQIGLPRMLLDEKCDARLLDALTAAAVLPRRSLEAHKGDSGHLLIFGGSPGTRGAALLSGRAALRGGAGLVTLLGDAGLEEASNVAVPELMTARIPEAGGGRDLSGWLTGLLDGKAAVVAGPGIGTTPRSDELLRALLESTSCPMVFDADGLNLLAQSDSLQSLLCRRETVLTPHPGEMARLLGCETRKVQQDRPGAARSCARKTRAVVVLKGARSVIALPDGRLYINPTGNPAMATAGTGDVLAGLIGALIAQGASPLEAAQGGTYLHGLAGDLLAETLGESGLLAHELADRLPQARRELLDSKEDLCSKRATS